MKLEQLVASLHCDIVSLERLVFSGRTRYLCITGESGCLGIAPGHAPLLTSIPPGYIRFLDMSHQDQLYYVEGGYMEVQPYRVTVLADTVLRATDIDLEKALEAKRHAESIVAQGPRDYQYHQAAHELLQIMAKMEVLSLARRPPNGPLSAKHRAHHAIKPK